MDAKSDLGKLPGVRSRLTSYEVIFNKKNLTTWISKLKKSSVFAFNTETNSSNNIGTSIIGFSFAIRPGTAAYVPIAYNYSDAPKQIPCEQVIELLKPILEDEKILKIGQNLKYSRNLLQDYGIELRGITFDISIESYILDNSTGRHDIISLFEYWLKNKTIIFDKITNKKGNQITFDKIDPEDAVHYAMENIDIVLQLHMKLWPKLQEYEELLSIFQDIEMPLVSVLSRMECNGVKIDLSVLHKYSKEITFRLYELKKKAYRFAGETFNLSSTKQLQTILLKKLDIKLLKKTSRGMLSTSKKVLEELALDHSLPRTILEYRELIKLKSTYIDKLPLMINQKTGRIHTSYHQTATITGRLSSTDPNLQNIPVRSKDGRRIRRAFIAPENYLIVSADYSQIELRIMAHFSRDEGLLTAFSEGKDIHCSTAAEIFGLPLENVTCEQRRSAKAINFGLIYGMSAFGLSRQLNIPHKESHKYMNLYFKRYPCVLEYMKCTQAQAKKKGYVETLNGRRLYLPDIKSNNLARQAAAKRAAINAPIQGTAADIIKQAMITIDTWIKKDQPLVRMIMQVHDELVFEVHKRDAKLVMKKIRNLMENNTVKLNLPLLVKISSGRNWDQSY